MRTYLPADSTTVRFIVREKSAHDPRSAAYLKDAHALGLETVSGLTCCDLYFIQGNLTQTQIEQIAGKLLHDPITQSIDWHILTENENESSHHADQQKQSYLIEVALRPGVTDPVAEQILRFSQVFSISDEINAASTGQRFVINGENLSGTDLDRLATRLLCNPVTQRYALGEILPVFTILDSSPAKVETLRLRGCTDQQLLQLSLDCRAALDLSEMRAIQTYCEREERDLTDIEFEMVAQTWSEHCIHKTFKSKITVENPRPSDEKGSLCVPDPTIIDNLFEHTIKSATRQINAAWVRSAFVDNAGIIEYDGVNELSFKVETHNHPSAIEPFGGANTGTGGVIRDVIGVSARPIAATDVLCFGPADVDFSDVPIGVLHPRRIASGVVSGIQDYGNKIGIPTVNGAILYDPGYTSNPLVFCGCAGIAPKDSHPRQALAGDHIVVIGGRTGRDGLRGATFSSMTMDAHTGEVAGASVQIGSPIVEKGLIDVTLAARQRHLYHAITDCGAGGLSSAVGEMASTIGAVVQLDRAPLKYPGLAPWEIWLSEAQERMVYAVSEESLVEFQSICDLYEVELTDIGLFTGSGRLIVRYGDQTVLDLENRFLHDGIPQRQMHAIMPHPANLAGRQGSLEIPNNFSFNQCLLSLLAHPNIASKEAVIRVYDHEVQGRTVIKPLTGANNDGPSDACVLRPSETAGSQALVLSAGINPEYGKLDTYQMALNVIDEALRNALAVGANPQQVAILDNFCWGDPRSPTVLGELVAAAMGCREGAVAYQTPFISGKDSFNNEYLGVDGKRHSIPPTLLISAIGILPDWSKAVSMDLKEPGNRVYLVGPFAPVFGGSHFNLVNRHVRGDKDGIPACQPLEILPYYRALYNAMSLRLVRACHDLSEGGLAVSAAEMCIGGRLGLDLDLGSPLELVSETSANLPGTASNPISAGAVRTCFGETTGCLLAEVRQQDISAFEACFSGMKHLHPLGTVRSDSFFRINIGNQNLLALPTRDLVNAWQSAAA